MSYASEVLADNPYSYWKLDEASGTTAKDSTPNGRDGTYTNTPTLNQASLVPSDPNGKSVLFPAASEHIVSTYLLNASTASLECWFSLRALPIATKYAELVGFANGFQSASNDKMLLIDENGKPRFYTFDGSPRFTSAPANAISLNTPYHFVGTVDANQSLAYLNGVLVGSSVSAGSQTGYTVNNVFVGANQSGGNGFNDADVYIDEVAIYDTAISERRIQAHYSAAFPTTLESNQQVPFWGG